MNATFEDVFLVLYEDDEVVCDLHGEFDVGLAIERFRVPGGDASVNNAEETLASPVQDVLLEEALLDGIDDVLVF